MRAVREFLSAFVKEYFYILTYPLAAFFHRPKHYRHPQPKGTILLVTCWFNPNIHHDKWISYLEQKGFRTYLVNLPLLHENFQTTAKRLKIFITEHKLTDYTLVGISTGAVVCLYFLQFYKKWDEIHRFVSVGGPLHGTWSAVFVSFAGKARDSLPRSRFVLKLESMPIPPGKMVTISAAFDELVPKKSSQMEGNTHYVVPVWGHNRFHLSSKATYELIAKIADSK